MPGINFAAVKASCPVDVVLGLWDADRRGNYIKCPWCDEGSEKRRMHIAPPYGIRCNKCDWSGNHLELLAELEGLDLISAAERLCELAGVDVPWVRRW